MSKIGVIRCKAHDTVGYRPECAGCQKAYAEATEAAGAPSSAAEAALSAGILHAEDETPPPTFDTSDVEPNREAAHDEEGEVCHDCGGIHPPNTEVADEAERAQSLVSATLDINRISHVAGEYALMALAFGSMKHGSNLTREQASERMMHVFNGVYGDTN